MTALGMTDVTETSHPEPILAEALPVSSTSVPLSANKFQSSYPMAFMEMTVLTLSLECHGENLSLQPWSSPPVTWLMAETQEIFLLTCVGPLSAKHTGCVQCKDKL